MARGSDRTTQQAGPETVPEWIGPYRLEGRLGKGGMGEVYRGYDDRLDRPVALKRVLGNSGEPEQTRRRFRREARILARLSHASIVQVHDWVEADGEDWLVMELIDGTPLSELQGKAPRPLAETIDIARQIASGLAAAHQSGIVHRDLKLSNLMWSEGGVKILDFGIAKPFFKASELSESSLTREGVVLGTVSAMSPEQALGHAIDHGSDLFSFGTLLYELLTGVSPFKGSTPTETLTRICTWQQEPAHELNPEGAQESLPPGRSSAGETTYVAARGRRRRGR